MTGGAGRIGLHGGGEYLPGDEPFLRLLLSAASASTSRVSGAPLRIVVVPVAAARGRPDAAGRHGIDAFERVAADDGIAVEAAAARVVDAASAADPSIAAGIAAADLIHLPGGDPDLVPGILRDSATLAAVCAALARGAVAAGASAGAMGLAEWTWTPGGVVPGLGLVRGLVVVPHFETISRARREAAEATAVLPGVDLAGLVMLGLDERTGVLSPPEPGAPWRVAGAGRAVLTRIGGEVEGVATDGEQLAIPGVTVAI